MSEVSQKTREYWVAKARGWAERLSGPQDDEFNAVMDDIMLSASRAEAAEARAERLQAALVGLMQFHPEDELGPTTEEFWTPEYKAAMDAARDALKGGK